MDITDIIDKGLVGYYLEADDNTINKELEEQVENMERFNEKKAIYLKKIRAKMEELNSNQTEK